VWSNLSLVICHVGADDFAVQPATSAFGGKGKYVSGFKATGFSSVPITVTERFWQDGCSLFVVQPLGGNVTDAVATNCVL
jgi:hypothetical protein